MTRAHREQHRFRVDVEIRDLVAEAGVIAKRPPVGSRLVGKCDEGAERALLAATQTYLTSVRPDFNRPEDSKVHLEIGA